MCKPTEWWKENYKDVGKKEGYSDKDILEYGEFINGQS